MKASRTARLIVLLGCTLMAFAVAYVTNKGADLAPKISVSFADATKKVLPSSVNAPVSDRVMQATIVKIVTSTVETNAAVTHVVDGDTLDAKIDGEGEVRIRLLGVNTPEVVDPRKPVECFGKEASAFTKSLLTDKRVQINADPQADERDKYGRLLRNVILEDGTDLNATLVASGFAHAYLSFPLNPERKRQITKLQNEAKEAERGLWASGACEK